MRSEWLQELVRKVVFVGWRVDVALVVGGWMVARTLLQCIEEGLGAVKAWRGNRGHRVSSRLNDCFIKLLNELCTRSRWIVPHALFY